MNPANPRDDKPAQAPRVMVWIGGFAPIGGIETFTADLCLAAARAGLEVDLLAWDRRSELVDSIRQGGVQVHCSPWRWGCRWHLPDWFLFPLALWKCRHASVVVFTKTASHLMHRIFRRVGKAQGQSFIYVTPYRPAEMWDDGVRNDPARRREAAELLNGFDRIVCQSEIFASDLRALDYHGQVEVMSYLPPAAVQNPAPYAAGPVTLGFLGRLEHQKNVPELLKVFSLLQQARQNPAASARELRLSVFGDGSLRAELESLARELGVESSVTFHGSIPRHRVRDAIRSCQLFCFTSHSEGQPLASLEILAEGRPIIATAVGAFPDMLADPALGTVVPVGETEAFIAAISRLLPRQEAGEIHPKVTADAYRARFDRDKTLRRYIDLLVSKPDLIEPFEGLPELGPGV